MVLTYQRFVQKGRSGLPVSRCRVRYYSPLHIQDYGTSGRFRFGESEARTWPRVVITG